MTSVQAKEGETRSSRARRGAVWFMLGSAVGVAVAWLVRDGFGAPQPIDPTLLEGPDLIARTSRFASVLEGASPASLDALREVAERFDPGPQEAELALFVDWWARFDPRAALAWAKTVEDATDLPLRMSAYRAWARSDPRAALADANATLLTSSPQLLGGATWQDPGLQAVLIGWDQSPHPGLEQWIFETEQAQERQGLMEHLARQRVATRPAAEVWAWATGLPGSLSDEMLPRVASAIAARDPLEAVRLAAPAIANREHPSLARRIATRWVRRDPVAAMEWLSALPEGGVQRDAVLETARTWLGVDQPGFMAYIEPRLDAFPEWLDPGFELYARTLAYEGSPRPAIAIAQRLRHPNRRDYTITLILRMWLAQDRGAAEAWMDEHGIDEGMRKRARHGLR